MKTAKTTACFGGGCFENNSDVALCSGITVHKIFPQMYALLVGNRNTIGCANLSHEEIAYV